MVSDNVTLDLNGEVSLANFAEAMGHFRTIVESLSFDLEPRVRIRWIVEQLEAGSAVATIQGIAPEAEPVVRIAQAFIEVGRHLGRQESPPYSEKVQSAARSLAAMLDGEITSIRFESGDQVAEVNSAAAPSRRPRLIFAFGTVEGRVRTISDSQGQDMRGLAFFLHETQSKRSVYCRLRPGQEELMREAWHNRAIVEGLVGRDPETGIPSRIQDVTDVIVVQEREPGSFRAAIGVLKGKTDDLPAEDLIRRTRNAW